MHQNENPFSFRPCRTNSWTTDTVSTLLSLGLLLLLLCTHLQCSPGRVCNPQCKGTKEQTHGKQPCLNIPSSSPSMHKEKLTWTPLPLSILLRDYRLLIKPTALYLQKLKGYFSTRVESTYQSGGSWTMEQGVLCSWNWCTVPFRMQLFNVRKPHSDWCSFPKDHRLQKQREWSSVKQPCM